MAMTAAAAAAATIDDAPTMMTDDDDDAPDGDDDDVMMTVPQIDDAADPNPRQTLRWWNIECGRHVRNNGGNQAATGRTYCVWRRVTWRGDRRWRGGWRCRVYTRTEISYP